MTKQRFIVTVEDARRRGVTFRVPARGASEEAVRKHFNKHIGKVVKVEKA